MPARETLDAEAESIAARSPERPDLPTDPEQPAYVIYTSGSTGQPKGVVVPHGHVTRLFSATRPWFGFGPDDAWTLFHSYAFDFSVWEIWGALLHGGRLVVVPHWQGRSPEAFYTLLRDERVTVLNQTPSAFRQLLWAEEAVLEGESPNLFASRDPRRRGLGARRSSALVRPPRRREAASRQHVRHHRDDRPRDLPACPARRPGGRQRSRRSHSRSHAVRRR